MIHEHHGVSPKIGKNTFIAPNAVVIGDVEIGENASVWFGVVMRGDVFHIRVGDRTNIQDGTICHVTNGKYALTIGNDVTIGHGAIVHGCTLHDHSFVGMGAKVLDGAVVSSYSMVAAGALVREGQVVPEGVLVAGVPAKIKREITDEERAMISEWSHRYSSYKDEYIKMGIQHEGV